MDDVREECGKYGVVKSIEIPRPIEGVDVPGCGKVISNLLPIMNCEPVLDICIPNAYSV